MYLNPLWILNRVSQVSVEYNDLHKNEWLIPINPRDIVKPHDIPSTDYWSNIRSTHDNTLCTENVKFGWCIQISCDWTKRWAIEQINGKPGIVPLHNPSRTRARRSQIVLTPELHLYLPEEPYLGVYSCLPILKFHMIFLGEDSLETPLMRHS